MRSVEYSKWGSWWPADMVTVRDLRGGMRLLGGYDMRDGSAMQSGAGREMLKVDA